MRLPKRRTDRLSVVHRVCLQSTSPAPVALRRRFRIASSSLRRFIGGTAAGPTIFGRHPCLTDEPSHAPGLVSGGRSVEHRRAVGDGPGLTMLVVVIDWITQPASCSARPIRCRSIRSAKTSSTSSTTWSAGRRRPGWWPRPSVPRLVRRRLSRKASTAQLPPGVSPGRTAASRRRAADSRRRRRGRRRRRRPRRRPRRLRPTGHRLRSSRAIAHQGRDHARVQAGPIFSRALPRKAEIDAAPRPGVRTIFRSRGQHLFHRLQDQAADGQLAARVELGGHLGERSASRGAFSVASEA